MPQKPSSHNSQRFPEGNPKGGSSRVTLGGEHFIAKKSLGQNFLTNPKIAEKIAQSAHLKEGDTVLEIGPGTGMLTRALLKEGVRVVAVEADLRAIEVLEKSFAYEILDKKLILIHGDMRTLELRDIPLPQVYKVVANIPYYLSGMLFAKMLECDHQPSTLVFLVQKEVAERIARSKKESILSLSIKAYGTPSYEGTVSRGNFSPQPGVDSAILAIRDISKKNFKTLTEKQFFLVLKTGFGARRKQLKSQLTKIAPPEEIAALFQELSLRPDARGEDLPLEIWLPLATRLHP